VLVIEKVSHQFGSNQVLNNVSLQSVGGEVTCLIGRSGCGKTTLLRLLAGLLRVQTGRILLDGDVLASQRKMLAPEERPIGMVFQEGALFPHMSVADNVAFGLPKRGARKLAKEWLKRVGLADFAERNPDSLSGGQRQRVALARAMAPEPRVLLFDEPYANLDAPLRRALRKDARRIIRDTGTVGLFVTHDPAEVLMMADHVAVLDRGLIVESGTPQALYDRPESRFAAELFGEPQVFEGTIYDDRIVTPLGEWERCALVDPAASNGDALLVVDADRLELRPDDNGIVITDIQGFGRLNRVSFDGTRGELTVVVDWPKDAGTPIGVGSMVRVVPKPGAVFASPSAVEKENDSHYY
jgi:iron(III) transport system ATP-binding protein